MRFTAFAGSLLAITLVPSMARGQLPDGPWPWVSTAPWHTVVQWSPGPGAAPEDVLRAARGALLVGRAARALEILDAHPVDDRPELRAPMLALRAAIHDARNTPDSAAMLYEEAARSERGATRGLLAARAGSAWEDAGRDRAAAAQYLVAATELPAVSSWLRLRAARAQGAPDGFGLLASAPPAAAGLARLVRGDLLLAEGDTARAVDALASGNARARAARLALGIGDSSTARRLAYAALAADDTAEVRAAHELVGRAMPPRSGAEWLQAGRGAARLREYRLAAEAAAAAAAEADAPDGAYVQWGEWLELAGRRADALAAYGRGGIEGAFRRARLQVRMGQRTAARAALLAFVAQYPDHARAAVALYLAAGLTSGDSLLQVVESRWPDDPYASRARLELAAAALRGGDSATAEGWYRREVERGGPQRQFARYVLARFRLAAGDGDTAHAVLAALARDDSVGYYGTIAREAARLPAPSFPPPPPREPAAAVREALRELDLLDAALFTEEAGRLLGYLLTRSWDDPDHLLDLAEGLIARGRAPEGISLGWRAAGRLGLNHPRVIRAVFPWPERDLIEAEAWKFGLDPFLLAGLIRQESSFKAAAQSRAGALGWMQLMPATGNWLARRLAVPWSDRMFTVADANLHLGSAHLAALIESFDGATVPALAAYNAGGTPVRRWLRARDASDPALFVETIPYAETREYVKTLVRNQALYRALYGPPAASSPDTPGALDSARSREPE